MFLSFWYVSNVTKKIYFNILSYSILKTLSFWHLMQSGKICLCKVGQIYALGVLGGGGYYFTNWVNILLFCEKVS